MARGRASIAWPVFREDWQRRWGHDLWVIGKEVARFDLPPSIARVRDSPLDSPHPDTFAAMSADTVLTSQPKALPLNPAKGPLTCGFAL
jgi:hypothetical protein